jgi:CHAT domain-containing protein/Tfp pilus assembly protein PilF
MMFSSLQRAVLVCAAMLCCGLFEQSLVSQQKEADPIVEARTWLAEAEAAHPGNTPEVAHALLILGQRIRVAKKTSPEALEIMQRAVKVSEAAAGKDSGLYALTLSHLARTYLAQDQGAIARPLAEQALEIARRKSTDPSQLAEVADTVDKICLDLHDYPCARQAGVEAVNAERLSNNKNELMLASMLQDLARIEMYVGDKEACRESMKESMAILQRQTKATTAMPTLEANAGAFLLWDKQYDAAQQHLKRALELSVEVYGADSMQVGHAEEVLASYYAERGDVTKALTSYEHALTLSRKWNGPMHTWTSELESHYSQALASTSDYPKALDLALQAHRSRREYFRLAIRLLPERQALALDKANWYPLEIGLSLLMIHPELDTQSVYQEVVRSRALVAEEMAQRQSALNRSNDPEIAKLLSELEKARGESLAEMQAPAAGKAPIQEQKVLFSQMEQIERELAEKSQAFRSNRRTRDVALDDIRQQLPKDAVLISYVTYYRLHFDNPKNDVNPIFSYMAFVMHPDTGQIHIYDLGDSKSIDEFVSNARTAADAEAHSGGIGSTRNERAYRDAALKLRQRVWDPLESELTKAKLVLVVPDGMLNLVPFSSLPDGDGYLVERPQVVHVLTSERDLVPSDVTEKKQGLLAIGSPAFELAVNNAAPSPLRGEQPSCDAFSKTEFAPLPGAKAEVAEIGSEWHEWNGAEGSHLITGEDATLGRFISDSPHNRVLHVATHAFVLDKSCGGGNPLLHSGLVFAGANKNHEGSILTAQQIASLDLSGVDWAVLSACNTGVGELHDGEGVLGLERAFRVAGARSVVMSLWPVGDEVTQRFMRELYAQRLGEHASTADALWNSSRKLLKEQRAAGKSTHPWYWAGFVGSGGWE